MTFKELMEIRKSKMWTRITNAHVYLCELKIRYVIFYRFSVNYKHVKAILVLHML